MSVPTLTILREARAHPIGKLFRRIGTGWRKSKLKCKEFWSEPVAIPSTFSALADLLKDVSNDPSACLIRDTPTDDISEMVRRKSENFPNRCSPFLPLDLDGIPSDELDLDLTDWSPGTPRDVEVIEAIRQRYLPPAFHSVPAIAVWSASMGWRKLKNNSYVPDPNPQRLSLHLWFILDRPIEAEAALHWCRALQADGAVIDPSLYHRVQPIYCGPPRIRGSLSETDAPPLLLSPDSRLVYLPAEACPNGWWGDERDLVSADLILSSRPEPVSPPSQHHTIANPTAAASRLANIDDKQLQKRYIGVAKAALSSAVAKLRDLTDSTARHRQLYAEAHRIAGFAATGLLDWNTARAELAEAGRTSGTEKALRHAEENPDDVSATLQNIAADHGQKRVRRQIRRGPDPNIPLPLNAARYILKSKVKEALLETVMVTVLMMSPGLGKTTALLRELIGLSSKKLFIFAAPNRRAAAEALQKLRSENARSELWLGRDGPSLYPHQTWEQPGIQPDGSTIQTCADERNLGRLKAGYRALCGRCIFRKQCAEGSDSLSGGYISANSAALKMIREGAGVLVITQDMLTPALAVTEKEDAPLAGIIIDEQPRIQTLTISNKEMPTLMAISPALGASIGGLLNRAAAEAASADRAAIPTLSPPQVAILQAHGRAVTSQYQAELRTLSTEAQAALPELERAENDGLIPRAILGMTKAIAERPESLTLHTCLGQPSTLQALGDRPPLPAGVPVIIADATADPRRIEAWSGRPVEIKRIRNRPHRGLRALMVDTKGFQRSRLGADQTETIANRLDRLGNELEAELEILAHKRQALSLPLSGLIVAPKRLLTAHKPAVDALLLRLQERGWNVAQTHWQSTESRGSDRYNGMGFVLTLGTPLQNLGSWMVIERGLSSWLGESLPPDQADPDSRERQRWRAEARAETWQAHGRLRSFTDREERPVLHIIACPDSDVPAELSTLPLEQRAHLSLQGRPSIAGTWVDRVIAEHQLQAIHPGLLSKLPGAPSLRAIRRYCQEGGSFMRSRRWRIAFTGGGSSGRETVAYAAERSPMGQVAASLERLAMMIQPELEVKTLQRDFIKGFDPSATPARKRPPRRPRWLEGAAHVLLPPPPTSPPSHTAPPVKADHADAAIPCSIIVSRGDQLPNAGSKTLPDPAPLPQC